MGLVFFSGFCFVIPFLVSFFGVLFGLSFLVVFFGFLFWFPFLVSFFGFLFWFPWFPFWFPFWCPSLAVRVCCWDNYVYYFFSYFLCCLPLPFVVRVFRSM